MNDGTPIHTVPARTGYRFAGCICDDRRHTQLVTPWLENYDEAKRARHYFPEVHMLRLLISITPMRAERGAA